MRQFLQNNLIILVLVNSASVFQYLFQVVVGRGLTPIDYGVFNSLNSLAALLATPVTIVHIVYSRFIVKLSLSGLGAVKSLLLKSLQCMAWVSGSAFLLGLLFLPWIQSFLHLDVALPIILMLVMWSLSLLFPLFFGMLEGLHRFTLLGIGTSGFAITRCLGGLVLVVVLGWGVNGALVAGILGSVVSMVFGIWSLRDVIKAVPVALPQNLYQDMGRYAIPVFLSTSMVMILGNIDIVLVRHYCTPEEAGLYATAAILGRVAFLLPSALLMVLFPSAAKARATGKEEGYILWVSMGMTALLGGSVALVLCLWPKILITLLFGEQYIEAASLLQIISAAMAMLAICNVVFSYGLARSELTFLWPLISGVALMLVLIIKYHDSAMTIAQILFVSTGVILSGTILSKLITFLRRPVTSP